MIDGICELVLETELIDETVAFYEGLGLEVILTEAEGERVWLATGERSRLGVWTPGRREHSDRGGSHVHFALSIEPGKIEPLAARLRDAGHEVEGPIEHDGGDRSIYVFDPAGNRVELWDFFERAENDSVAALAD